MTWDEVLERDDIVGGDLEIKENGDLYRGPIKTIELTGEKIVIEREWTALLPLASGKKGDFWQKWENNQISFHQDFCLPNDIGAGRVLFEIPTVGWGVIFPKGGSKLDPAKVEGLELN